MSNAEAIVHLRIAERSLRSAERYLPADSEVRELVDKAITLVSDAVEWTRP